MDISEISEYLYSMRSGSTVKTLGFKFPHSLCLPSPASPELAATVSTSFCLPCLTFYFRKGGQQVTNTECQPTHSYRRETLGRAYMKLTSIQTPEIFAYVSWEVSGNAHAIIIRAKTHNYLTICCLQHVFLSNNYSYSEGEMIAAYRSWVKCVSHLAVANWTISLKQDLAEWCNKSITMQAVQYFLICIWLARQPLKVVYPNISGMW